MEQELLISEIKEIQLEILKDVHKFCIENDIKYSLAYGTLLGAIRHKGYIPWDDDIDIWMGRDDYNKFMNMYSSPRYKKVYKYKKSEINLPFGKVYDSNTILIENANHSISPGIYIDIFPIDKINYKNIRNNRDYIKLLYKIKTIKEIRVSGKRSVFRNFILLLLKSIFTPISYKCLLKGLQKHSIATDDYRDYRLTDYNDYINTLEFEAKIFNELLRVEFEGCIFLAFKDYDNILKNCYGDYLKLPPLEEQITHHDYKAYKKCKD